MKLEFSHQIFKESHTSNFMKIRPVGVADIDDEGMT
jgi:hypothetical protein